MANGYSHIANFICHGNLLDSKMHTQRVDKAKVIIYELINILFKLL